MRVISSSSSACCSWKSIWTLVISVQHSSCGAAGRARDNSLAQFSQNGSILKTVRVISRKAIVGFRRVHKDAEAARDNSLAQFSQNGSILKTVRVISRKAIVGFRRVHKDAEGPLDAWYRTVLRARWRNLAQARMDFPHADAVGERTAFN